MQNHEIWHEPGPGVSVQAGGGWGDWTFKPSRAACDRKTSKTFSKIALFPIFQSNMGRKKVEIEGVGPIWRAPGRNSASRRA